MTPTSPVAPSDAPGAAGADAARGLSEAAFASLADRHRREIHVHCYRLPAAASYLRRPGDSAFRAFKLDVLRIDNHAIAEITTFGYALFPAFGLPSTL